MTGYAEFPDMTGPRPLLLPATATKTVGTLSPEGRKLCYHNKSSFYKWKKWKSAVRKKEIK